jgi:tetratricopeptide (TPR) repeat protein
LTDDKRDGFGSTPLASGPLEDPEVGDKSSPFAYTLPPSSGTVVGHADVTLDLGASFASRPKPAQGSDTPLPVRIGRYRILERVGGGGMGVVYRAIDPDAPAREVALKTVRARGADGLASLRREIHALKRVVHPGVVRILDDGLDAGLPYYTMELIQGPTLATLLHAHDREARLPEILEIVRRLCETLAFLHGLGVVHRDLTPKNVIVRADGTPVLVDFGLALRGSRPGRDVLDADSVVGGTMNYIAPEQLRGDPIDPRADLYALGCILYEALTGTPPFESATVADTASRQLFEKPAAPSSLVRGIDPALEALVLKLLQKRRGERMGYAEDVAARLAPFCRAPSSGSRVAEDRARPYIYRPGFVGRDDLLAATAVVLRRALEGQGARVLIGGEGGVGKTRFLGELAGWARTLGFLVAGGECSGLARAVALQPFRPVLDALAALASASVEAADRLVGARGKLLAPFTPDLAALPGQDAYPEQGPRPPQQARDDLLAALAESIARLAAEAPLLIMIDDVDEADELSLDLLASLPPAFFASRRVALVASHRPLRDSSSTLQALLRDPATMRLTIDRFDGPSLDRMAGEMLALAELPPALRTSLESASEGNPFFVSELLRLALDEGWLRRPVGATWEFGASAAIPRSVSELCERRIAVLSPATKVVADALAVVGHRADLALLASVSATADVDVIDALADLEGRALVDEVEEHFRFVHEKVRDAAYAALPAATRVTLHRRAAEALELEPGDRDPAVLARHWAEASVRPRAVDRFEEAGDLAMDRAAHAEATAFYRMALQLSDGEKGARAARWHRRIGEALFALGRLPACEEHAAAALAAVGHPLPKDRSGWARRLVVELARQTGHVLVPTSRASARRRDAGAEEAALAAALLSVRFYFEQEELPLLASSLLAVNFAEDSGLNDEISLPYAQLGFLAGVCKLRRRSDAYFARAHRGAEAANDVAAQATVMSHEALLHACQARYERARTVATRALELSGRRVPQEREVAHIILSHMEYVAGRYHEAVQHGEQLFESARARQNLQHEAFGHFAVARSLIRDGRHAQALERVEAVRTSGADRHDALIASIRDGLAAQALSGLGAHDTALEMADSAMAAVARADQAFSLADGYEGAAEVYLDAWDRARRERLAPSPVWVQNAATAGAAMLRFAALFPMGEPRWLLHMGRTRLLRGDTRTSHLALRLAASRARALGMPFEAARADALLTVDG